MRVHEAVAQALIDNGVDTMFGLMGDSNMLYIVDYQSLGGRYIGTVIEGPAVSMADGYFRASGKVGVVSVSHGPAATNALTSLTEAVKARSSIVMLTADAPAYPWYHAQRFDLQSLARTAGAVYIMVRRPEDLLESISVALRRAATEHVPVVLDVPVDLVREEVEAGSPRARPATGLAVTPLPDEPQIDRAVELIRSSLRPVVLAGRGVTSATAPDVAAFADAIGAPLATTLLAKDLFQDHPFNLGVSARLGTEASARTLPRADALIVFGAGLDDFMTMDGKLLEGKRIVQVDIDPARLAKFHAVDVEVVGDAGAVARLLKPRLQDYRAPESLATDELAAELAAYDPRATFESQPAPGMLDLRTASIELDERLPRNRFVVTDAGRFMWAPWRHVRVFENNSFVHTMHFGSIGLALGIGMGAAAANPDRIAVAVVGDVGGMMNLMDFRTAVVHQLPLVVAMLNDNCFGAEYPKFERFGYDPSHSMVIQPDFASVVAALGGQAITVREVGDFEQVSAAFAQGRFPILLDIQCDPTIELPQNPYRELLESDSRLGAGQPA